MLLRPMLEERRGALRDWLTARGRDWIEDPANQKFHRGEARRALVSLPWDEGLRLAERGEAPAEGVSDHPPTGSRPRLSPFRARTMLSAVRPSSLPLGEGFQGGAPNLAMVLLCAAGHDRRPDGDRLSALQARLDRAEPFAATLAGARVSFDGADTMITREPGELRRRPLPPLSLLPDTPAVWDGRYQITAREPGWSAVPALGRLASLSRDDRVIAGTAPAPARAGLPVLIRDGADAPVLAWRAAEVLSLAPRRLSLALGETTQEWDLRQAIHGETPPPDLF